MSTFICLVDICLLVGVNGTVNHVVLYPTELSDKFYFWIFKNCHIFILIHVDGCFFSVFIFVKI